jgi:hypothetical protein
MMACSSACRDTAAAAAGSPLAGTSGTAATVVGPAAVLGLAIVVLVKLVLEGPVALAAVLERVELGA